MDIFELEELLRAARKANNSKQAKVIGYLLDAMEALGIEETEEILERPYLDLQDDSI